MPHAENTNVEQRGDLKPAASQRAEDSQTEPLRTEITGNASSETPAASGLTHRLSSVARPDPADQVSLLPNLTYLVEPPSVDAPSRRILGLQKL